MMLMCVLQPLPGMRKSESKPPVAIVELDGYLSRYDEQPTIATLEYRKSIGDVPSDKKYDGYIAVLSCDYIGLEGILSTTVGDFQVVVYDCAGNDGGHSWMKANDIVAEIDWYLYEKHSSIVGSHASLVLYEN